MNNTLSYALDCDANDSLKEFRDEFLFPSANGSEQLESSSNCPKAIYLCGNSLGLQPKGVQNYVLKQLEKWHHQGVEGHFTEPYPWLTIDDIVKESMSKLVGASTDEVVMMNTLTCNIHFMMSAMYKPTPERYKILIEKKAFPSDTHAMKSQLIHHGYSPELGLIEVVPREGEETLHMEDIEKIITQEGSSIAVIHFSGIQYYTGQFFNIKKITELGHAQNCIVGFDLAHAVGNVPLQLHEWNVDFATWCSYKYLNCGPGSIGGCFLHNRHTIGTDYENNLLTCDNISNNNIRTRNVSATTSVSPLNRLCGWWGHRVQDRFLMSGDFIPETGVYGFRVSNPSVLLMACVRASMDVFDKAGMDRLRKKSIQLTSYLEYLLLTEISPQVLKIFTPSQPSERGCQLSISFLNGLNIDAIYEELKLLGIICDVRKPNVMRVAPTPLYNSFFDVYEFIQKLKFVIQKVVSDNISK